MDKVITVRRGRDGRDYPGQMPPSPDEQRRARILAHNLICRDGSSYRQALEIMRGYGIRRSRGWLTKIIRGYDCGPACKGSPPEPEPQPTPAAAEPVAAAVHQRPGSLTGMIDG